ncbi:cellulose-binding protein [Streptomyces taklimakanensis]|uniref:cellulose-binding protein n=1 Tax=Streptomyces taklimakanensis TaxID=2569853 RepID=UPI00192E59F4|nr:cellulose-binding protein [Streptomyces taklimakanensis]
MSASKSPHGFTVVRGRGYRPEQVDRFADELYRDLEEARERLTRLGVLAGELEGEADRLRSAVAALPPPSFEALGERAGLLLSEVEAEAGELRARAEAEAGETRERAEAEARARRDAAHDEAARVRAEADAAAEAVVASAREAAAEVRAAARDEAGRSRDEAERGLRETAERCEALLLAQERKQAEESEALDRALAARESTVAARVADLTGRGESLLDRARRERAEAEAEARRLQDEAEARAADLLARARLRQQRIERETERILSAHEQRAEAMRRHMAHVRAGLATLTGRGADEGREADGSEGSVESRHPAEPSERPGGGTVPGQGAPAE